MSSSITRNSTIKRGKTQIPIIEDLDEVLKKSEHNIFLFGRVESGKTYLANNLCDCSFKTQKRGFSCTHTVQHGYSRHFNMIIIDFPGLKSAKNIMLHLRMQKEALSTIPVRLICFIVKNDRLDQILSEINELKKIFFNYLENVAIIITNSEDCDQKEIKEITHVVSKKSKINKVFLTSGKTNFYNYVKI